MSGGATAVKAGRGLSRRSGHGRAIGWRTTQKDDTLPPLTWHLCYLESFLFEVTPVRCHVCGREGVAHKMGLLPFLGQGILINPQVRSTKEDFPQGKGGPLLRELF